MSSSIAKSHADLTDKFSGWLGLRLGVDDSIKTADVILVLDRDVPWINTLCLPSKDAKIYHIDCDPLKQRMPIFYIDAIARYRANSFTAVQQLNNYISSNLIEELSSDMFSRRWENLHKSYSLRLQTISDLAQPTSEGHLSSSYLASRLRHFCPKDTIWVIEAVTNTIFIADQLQATLPGSWVNSLGGGLGWSGGAALGIKLATDASGEHKFVCQIVGDGTFLFSVPGSVYWIAQRYNIPVLTIVLNNNGWNAPRRSLLLVHPEGEGSKVTNEELHLSFAPAPDFAGIAKAAAGGNLFASSVSAVEDLDKVLAEAVEKVLSGTSAVIDAHLNGPQSKFGHNEATKPS